MATTEVQIMLSGGAGNSDPALSLGGAVSTTPMAQQTATSAITAPFSIDYAALHDVTKIGGGTLTYIAGSTAFTWQPNGAASAGPPIPIAASSTVAVPDVDDIGFLSVTQAGAGGTIPVADTSYPVTVGHNTVALFPAVNAADSAAGFVRHRLVFLQNNSAATLTLWRGYVPDQADGGVAFAFGVDPGGVDSSPATIADQTVAPAGVTFAAPSTDLATGTLLPDIPAGSSLPIWYRLTLVGAGSEINPNFSLVLFGATS